MITKINEYKEYTENVKKTIDQFVLELNKLFNNIIFKYDENNDNISCLLTKESDYSFDGETLSFGRVDRSNESISVEVDLNAKVEDGYVYKDDELDITENILLYIDDYKDDNIIDLTDKLYNTAETTELTIMLYFDNYVDNNLNKIILDNNDDVESYRNDPYSYSGVKRGDFL